MCHTKLETDARFFCHYRALLKVTIVHLGYLMVFETNHHTQKLDSRKIIAIENERNTKQQVRLWVVLNRVGIDRCG